MEKHQKILVFGIGMILVMLAIGLSGCTEEEKSSDLGYKNTEYGFALNPPEGWTVEENTGFLGTVAMFLGPTEDNFNINMVITANISDSGDKLDTAVEEFQIFLSDSDITIDISRETIVNEMNAYEFVYSANTLKQKMILVEKGNLVLGLVYSALENSYDNYVTVFDESTFDNLLLMLKPDFLCKGSDYTVDTVPGREKVKSYEGKLAIVGGDKIRNISEIVKEIRDRR